MTERKVYGIGPAGRAFAASVTRLADAMEFAATQPHAYWPSAMHMGDCAICGNTRDAPLHTDGVTANAKED